MNSIRYAMKRFWKQPLLVLSVFIGLLIAVAMVTTVPLYSNAATFRVLERELSIANESSLIQSRPFDFVYRYIGSWHGNLLSDQLTKLNDYFDNRISDVIGLPIEERVNFVSTDNLQLFPLGLPQISTNVLDLVKLAYMDNFKNHITVIDGSIPIEGNLEIIELLASNDLANQLGMSVGKEYILRFSDPATDKHWTKQVKIAGIWIPKDPFDTYWSFYTSESFAKKLILNKTDFDEVVSTNEVPINETAWRLSLNGDGISSQNVDQTLNRINTVQNQLNSIVVNTNLELSPVAALQQFSQTSNELTRILIFFSLPILVMIILFLMMISDLFARSQQNEIAILRSRGASRRWIVGIYFWQWLMIGIAAIAGGLLLGILFSRFVSNTYSFMVFSTVNSPVPTLGRTAYLLALSMVSVAIFAMLIPIYKVSKETILGYKRSTARNSNTEFWQKAYLDLLLLAVSVYGLYVLRSQGRLTIFGKSLGGNDPFTNPLMFLLPTLFILSLLLFSLRILPLIIELLNRLVNKFQGASLILVLRQFARSGRAHHASLLLLGLTISIAFFASSMAATIDQGMHDNVYYQNGADIHFYEGGEFVKIDSGGTSDGQPNLSQVQEGEGYWNLLPVTDYLSIPGVLGATRVGYYQANAYFGGVANAGSLMGIDRDSFGSIAFSRPDFSAESFSGLLNRLASSPDAVLINEELWNRYNLNVGDVIELQTSTTNLTGNMKFKVAGVFKYFPGWNRAENLNAFVVNLDYLFDTWGRMQPYDVFLKTSPTASLAMISERVNLMGVTMSKAADSRGALQNLIFSPKRQGALGLLSVGFISSTILAIIAILIYVIFTFRERSIHFGVLRAIGLSSSQLKTSLVMEIGMIAFLGVLLGNLVGSVASRLFIPVFPVNVQGISSVLPQSTTINWSQILWMNLVFIATFVVICLVYLFLSNKDREFAAIKLGETT